VIWNWLRRHPRIVDVAIFGLVLVGTLLPAARHSHAAAGIFLGTLAAAALLWRRSHPATVVAIAAAATIGAVAVGAWAQPFALAFALYTLAAARGPSARTLGAIAIVATGAAFLATWSELGDAPFHVAALVAGWLLGDSIGTRRAYVREIEEKAERLERERESEARRAAAEEQARIGRELHDVVAHALSVIVVQAGAADDVFDADPQQARGAIRAVDAAARTALADLRRVLGVLHDGAEYAPQPGLAGLDSLVEQVRRTGLGVSLAIEGRARPLPAAVDLSAYRIVQEALTNTLKHANAEHVSVRIRYGEVLALEIRDDGRGPVNGSHSGNGVIGMRERAAMLGGTVDTGPAGGGGGYLVSARIPIAEPR
jgi:signal transduction histidine kinase